MRCLAPFTYSSRAGALPPTAFAARYAVLCVAVSFAFSVAGPMLSWLTGNLRGTGATTLIVPLNVSIAAGGQIIGASTLYSSTGHCLSARPLTRSSVVTIPSTFPPDLAHLHPCPALADTAYDVGIFIYKSSEAPGFPTGHYTNAGFMFAGSLGALLLRWVYVRRNRALAPGEPKWRL